MDWVGGGREFRGKYLIHHYVFCYPAFVASYFCCHLIYLLSSWHSVTRPARVSLESITSLHNILNIFSSQTLRSLSDRHRDPSAPIVGSSGFSRQLGEPSAHRQLLNDEVRLLDLVSDIQLMPSGAGNNSRPNQKHKGTSTTKTKTVRHPFFITRFPHSNLLSTMHATSSPANGHIAQHH